MPRKAKDPVLYRMLSLCTGTALLYYSYSSSPVENRWVLSLWCADILHTVCAPVPATSLALACDASALFVSGRESSPTLAL